MITKTRARSNFDDDNYLNRLVIKRTLKDYHTEIQTILGQLFYNDISIDEMEDMLEDLLDEYSDKLLRII